MKGRLFIKTCTAVGGTVILALTLWTSSVSAQGWSPVPGVTVEFAGTADILTNIHGGRERGTAGLYSADVLVSLDGQDLGAWRGLSAYGHGMRLGGGSPTQLVGDIQGVSNIEAPEGWVLYEAWVEQVALGGRVSFVGGRYGVDSEFDVIQSASLFMHSSHGIGPDFSQIGRNGPSIFPETRWGGRARALTSPSTSMQVAVLHDNPGVIAVAEGSWFAEHRNQDPAPLQTPRQAFRRRLVSRMATIPLQARVAVGVWSASGGAPGRRGAWMLGESRLPTQSQTAVFARIGVSERGSGEPANRIRSYTGAGVVHAAPFPGRDDDTVGLGMAIAHENGQTRETTVEATYRTFLSPRLSVQGDAQWVQNPLDTDGATRAVILGLRLLASW